jgi:hypothetical protein
VLKVSFRYVLCQKRPVNIFACSIHLTWTSFCASETVPLKVIKPFRVRVILNLSYNTDDAAGLYERDAAFSYGLGKNSVCSRTTAID